MSGKKRRDTIKTTSFSDHQGRTLLSWIVRPGRMHDQTCVRSGGVAEQFRQHPGVKAEVTTPTGPCERVPRSGLCPAEEVRLRRLRCLRRREAGLARGETAAVLGSDPHRAHQRRAEEMAPAPTVHRTPRHLHRNPCSDCRPRLRPFRKATDPATQQHRPGACPYGGLLNHPSAESPGQPALNSIAPKVVSRPQRPETALNGRIRAPVHRCRRDRLRSRCGTWRVSQALSRPRAAPAATSLE